MSGKSVTPSRVPLIPITVATSSRGPPKLVPPQKVPATTSSQGQPKTIGAPKVAAAPALLQQVPVAAVSDTSKILKSERPTPVAGKLVPVADTASPQEKPSIPKAEAAEAAVAVAAQVTPKVPAVTIKQLTSLTTKTRKPELLKISVSEKEQTPEKLAQPTVQPALVPISPPEKITQPTVQPAGRTPKQPISTRKTAVASRESEVPSPPKIILIETEKYFVDQEVQHHSSTFRAENIIEDLVKIKDQEIFSQVNLRTDQDWNKDKEEIVQLDYSGMDNYLPATVAVTAAV
jgi:hypothetical protein